MLQAKAYRRFRTLVLLACTLSIVAVGFDGRTAKAKAQLTPVCTTLNTMATLLAGSLDSCVSTGSIQQLASLHAEASFSTELLASLMAQQSLQLLNQQIEIQTLQQQNRYFVIMDLNE
jgi:DNA-binding transcriptional regulator YbjK